MALTLRYAVRSDRGLVRNNNEDSVYAGPRLLAIADGMGGHAGGEVASKIVIGAVEELDEDRPIADLITTLRNTVDDASVALAQAVAENRTLEGMGTTLTAIRFAGSRIALVHVGDSRAYLMRGGQLAQITHDDTYVQSLVDSGKLTAEEASHHPRRSMILRALDGSAVDPDISIREARLGDRYLLCSDGLSDVVTASTLLEALSSGSPQECADRLIELALRGGGPDNVTCIVADVVDPADGDDLPIVGGAVLDRDQATDSDLDSPAGRAARISQPPRVEAVGRAASPARPPAAGRAGGADRAAGRHGERLRLDPDPVLRRQGRQRGGGVPRRERPLRPGQPGLGGGEQRPQGVRPDPIGRQPGQQRHHRQQPVRRRGDPEPAVRPAQAAVRQPDQPDEHRDPVGHRRPDAGCQRHGQGDADERRGYQPRPQADDHRPAARRDSARRRPPARCRPRRRCPAGWPAQPNPIPGLDCRK